MKKFVLFFVLFFSLTAFQAYSQCGTISLIGEFNGWAADYPMEQDAVNPDLWSTVITLTSDMNMFGDADIIEVKFRQDADWAVNWGAVDFPHGFGYQDGPNIPVSIDLEDGSAYLVGFNCSTGEYTFSPYKEVPVAGWAIALSASLILILAVLRFRRLI